MKLSLKNREFRQYCRHMYDENCHERSEHGQQPYINMEAYVTKNKLFLEGKFEQLHERRR